MMRDWQDLLSRPPCTTRENSVPSVSSVAAYEFDFKQQDPP